MMTHVASLVGYDLFYERVLKHGHSRFYGEELFNLTKDDLIYLIGDLNEQLEKRRKDDLLFKPQLDAVRLIAELNGQYRTVDSVREVLKTSDPGVVRGVLNLSVKVRKAWFRGEHGEVVYTTNPLTWREIVTAISQLITNRW